LTTALGKPLDRVDGLLKATGTANYTGDLVFEGMVHAALVQSSIARGRIAELDTSLAEDAEGVLAILTHRNMPRIRTLKPLLRGGGAMQTRPPMQDDLVRHAGESLAFVVAESLELARRAADLVNVRYEELTTGRSGFPLPDDRGSSYKPHDVLGLPPDLRRGAGERALGAAEVLLDLTFRTPIEHHNPIEPAATIATWSEAGALTVYEATQAVNVTRAALAEAMGISRRKVRVVSRFLGGGFGCKGWVWPHTILAALAARALGRPVKIVLTRGQMFTNYGYRPETVQRLRIGARGNGMLTAIVHESTSTGSDLGEFAEPCGEATKLLYSCPNLVVRHRLVRQNLGAPSLMRAPGAAPGSFALESALDELAETLSVDPIELRLRNHAERDPDSGRSWSSKRLRECYREGIERFGWLERDPRPRSMRDGRWLVGYGMASAFYTSATWPAFAQVEIHSNGTARIHCATQDLGTGTYTVMAQVAADALGVPPAQVVLELGDSRLPFTMGSGSSSTVRSVGPVIRAAALGARAKVVKLAIRDPRSPLHRAHPAQITAENGELFLTSDPTRRESYAAVLGRAGIDQVEARRRGGIATFVHESLSHSLPGPLGSAARMATAPFASRHTTLDFGAQFVEVRVDQDLGVVRVTRALGVYDIGTVLNAKTARSQAIGGITWGIGMALLEQSPVHPHLDKFVSPNLTGYLMPTNADVPDIDVHFLDIADPHVNSLGAKGAGELCIVGVAAAIANAVYHAIGRRVRRLPIEVEDLLLNSRPRHYREERRHE